VDKAYALFSIGKYYESKLSADAVMLQSNLDAPPLADAGLEASAVYNNDAKNYSNHNIFAVWYNEDRIFLVIFAVLLVLVIGLAASLELLLFRLKEAKPATNLVTNLPYKLKLHIMKRNPEHVEESSRRRLPLSLQSHSKSSQANPIFSNSSFLSNSEDHELRQSPRATKSAVLPAVSSTQTTESPLPFSSSTPLNKANITITSTSAKVGEQAKQKEGDEKEKEKERRRRTSKIFSEEENYTFHI
jgi:hypothetical protein